ncbi:MAG: hypothetical protein MK132_18475 [Lentisphaerales bacterium]|nr:hypothetical protein [Lentisphaerales bacterium]
MLKILLLLLMTFSASAQLLEEKLVLAHFMTGDIQKTIINGKPFNGVSSRYADYSKDGSYAAIGGMNQALPFYLEMDRDKTVPLREVVQKELRAAKKYGIDGFHFYYPLVRHDTFMKNYNAIISMFFEVAREEYPEFIMTLCLCNPTGGSQVEKVALWSYHIRNLMKDIGESQNWLKTKDDRYLFFLWCQDGLADVTKDHHWSVNRYPERVAKVADAYRDLAQSIGIEAAYMYDIRFPENDQLVDEVLKHFDGVWSWTDNLGALSHLEKVIDKSRAVNKTFCLTVYPDYYTGKLYNKKPPYRWQRVHPGKASKINRNDYSRHYHNCGLSMVYRQLFEFAVRHDLSVISITSWNDYPEGHHIAPEANHNFAPAVLLEYYKNKWQGRAAISQESLSVFYKKYRSDILPQYNFAIHTKLSVGPEILEDDIEVISILQKAGKVFFNGAYLGQAEPGLSVFRVPSKPGKVSVKVVRESSDVLSVNPPEWITDKPYRTDRFTYMYSSRFDEYFEDIFGDKVNAPALKEYAEE